MVRRATAVISACLLTAGAIPPVPALASAVPGMSDLPGCVRPARVMAPGRGSEPHAPPRAGVAEMLADARPRRSRPHGHRIPITVPTWVHIITDGMLGASDTAARNQIATLNAAYSGQFGGVDTGIRFRLDGLTRTTNELWFRDPLSQRAGDQGDAQGRSGDPQPLHRPARRAGARLLHLPALVQGRAQARRRASSTGAACPADRCAASTAGSRESTRSATGSG